MIKYIGGYLKILVRWRYWPMEIFYFPLTVYVFTIGFIRTRKLFYFSAANPKVSMGGFACDSKYDIIRRVPQAHKPVTFLVKRCDNFMEVVKRIKQYDMQFPLMVKPDIGEGGFLVKKMNCFAEFNQYHHRHSMDYIVQEFVADPLELSILLHNSDGGLHISSITERKYLVLKGDGRSTVRQLIEQHPTAMHRQRNIKKMLAGQLDIVVGKDTLYEPSCIGNWDYGATYVDRSEIINKYILKVFKQLNTEVDLFNYSRIDLKCASVHEFLQGKFKVLEINGVKGEPIHIYDRKTSILKAYGEIFKHWEYILEISQRNIRNGATCPGLFEGLRLLWKHRKLKLTALQPRISL